MRPAAFKALVGRGHDEFSSARQQVGLPPAAATACDAGVPIGARRTPGSQGALCVPLFWGRSRYRLGVSGSSGLAAGTGYGIAAHGNLALLRGEGLVSEGVGFRA